MTAHLAAPQSKPARPAGRRPTPVIAFLGTGRMGGPMAANLARVRFDVRAWGRPPGHAAAFAEAGVRAPASPAEAIRGAGLLITMLADGPATDQVWETDALLA